MAKDKKASREINLGWFTRNYSVFELLVKTILFTLLIPYASIFLNGLIFDRWLKLYAKSVASPIIILTVAVILALAGLIISVLAIIRYAKHGPATRAPKKAETASGDPQKTDNDNNPT